MTAYLLREEGLAALRDGRGWDILIVGGGASGLGAAVDAADALPVYIRDDVARPSGPDTQSGGFPQPFRPAAGGDRPVELGQNHQDLTGGGGDAVDPLGGQTQAGPLLVHQHRRTADFGHRAAQPSA